MRMAEVTKPDRSDSPRFFIGAIADSGINFNHKLNPAFQIKINSFNLKSRFQCPLVISVPLFVSIFLPKGGKKDFHFNRV